MKKLLIFILLLLFILLFVSCNKEKTQHTYCYICDGVLQHNDSATYNFISINDVKVYSASPLPERGTGYFKDKKGILHIVDYNQCELLTIKF